MTKPELEARILALETTTARQRQALDKLSSKNGVKIRLSNWPHNAAFGSAPYIKPGGNADTWRNRVLPVISRAVMKHGIKCGDAPGCHGKGEIDLSQSGGTYFTVPTLVADMIVELLNAAADFGNDCYQAGLDEGADLLRQLANGQLKAGDFEDQTGIERAKERRQDWKKYRVSKYEH